MTRRSGNGTNPEPCVERRRYDRDLCGVRSRVHTVSGAEFVAMVVSLAAVFFLLSRLPGEIREE